MYFTPSQHSADNPAPLEPPAPGTEARQRHLPDFPALGAWVLERIWSMFIEECAELGGVEWEWQSADYALCEAGFGEIR